MRRAGSLFQFVGGGIGRVALSGILIGLFLVLVGVTPGQFVADVIQHPPALVRSYWFSPTIAIVGVALIAASLWFNVWSLKQKCIDALAEDMAWAIQNLLNRSPTPVTDDQIAVLKRDIDEWYGKISRQLENRAFFTRADQIHFDFLGYVEPIAMAGVSDNRLHNMHSQLRMKFARLRDVINWAQQRRR
jgi:hypothetical protein